MHLGLADSVHAALMANDPRPHMKQQWMQDAVKPSHRGLLTAQANRAGKSVHAFASEHAHDRGSLGQRARFAITATRIAHKHAKYGEGP